MLDSVFNASRPRRSAKLEKKDGRLLIWPLVIIAGVVLADQVTKIWAISNLVEHASREVMGQFVMFSLVFNEGGAMGTRIGPSLYYLIMALIVLPFVLYYIYRNRNQRIVSLPLSFIAGGAIGNLIDRIGLGKVIDFIDVDFFDIDLFGFHLTRWWTFNIADAAISCAIVFLAAIMILNRKSLDPDDETVSTPTAAAAQSSTDNPA